MIEVIRFDFRKKLDFLNLFNFYCSCLRKIEMKEGIYDFFLILKILYINTIFTQQLHNLSLISPIFSYSISNYYLFPNYYYTYTLLNPFNITLNLSNNSSLKK